jgi:hypothetical protein
MHTPADRNIFYSKISWGLVLFISLALVIPLGFMLAEGIWLGVAILVLTALLPLSICLNTSYEVKAGNLLITSGFLFKQTVPVQSIRSIKPSRTILASPALSFDRQEIRFNQYDEVFISLKDEDKFRFYEELKRINPAIAIN